MISIAKRQGWFVRGKSINFWSSRSAYTLKRRWIIRRRQQAARNARLRRIAHLKRQRIARINAIGKRNWRIAYKKKWFTRRSTNLTWWANWKNVMRVRAGYYNRMKAVASRNMARARS